MILAKLVCNDSFPNSLIIVFYFILLTNEFIGALKDEVQSFRCEIRGEKFTPSKRYHLTGFTNRKEGHVSQLTSRKDVHTFPGRKEKHRTK